MMQFENIVFWSYVALLLIGGLIGFYKSKSQVSLVTSAIAAAILILARLPGVLDRNFGRNLANFTMLALLVVFAIRLTKTKKFIPSGLLLVLTAVVLIMLNFHH